MFLKIQADEALDSYCSRFKHLFKFEPKRLEKLGLVGNNWSQKNIRSMASFLGWEGCFGFNRMLYSHTNYHLCEVSSPNSTFPYSRFMYALDYNLNRHVRGGIAFDSVLLCVECIAEDLQVLGYSYWRRSHQFYVRACAKHRVWLLESCQFCGRRFSLKGFISDVLWESCACGRFVVESKSEQCDSFYELKLAKLCADLYGFKYSIPRELIWRAVSVRRRKGALKSTFWFDEAPGCDSDYYRRVVRSIHSNEDTFNGLHPELSLPSDYFFQVLLFMYSSFEEFLDSLDEGEKQFPLAEVRWVSYEEPYWCK